MTKNVIFVLFVHALKSRFIGRRRGSTKATLCMGPRFLSTLTEHNRVFVLYQISITAVVNEDDDHTKCHLIRQHWAQPGNHGLPKASSLKESQTFLCLQLTHYEVEAVSSPLPQSSICWCDTASALRLNLPDEWFSRFKGERGWSGAAAGLWKCTICCKSVSAAIMQSLSVELNVKDMTKTQLVSAYHLCSSFEPSMTFQIILCESAVIILTVRSWSHYQFSFSWIWPDKCWIHPPTFSYFTFLGLTRFSEQIIWGDLTAKMLFNI